MKSKADTTELDDLIKKIKRMKELAESYDGKKIDLNKEHVFVASNFLHQDRPGQTKEQSAAFERNNKRLFDFVRSIHDKMGGTLK